MPRLQILRVAVFVTCVHSAFVVPIAVAADSTPLLDQGPLGAQLRSAVPEIMPRLEAQVRNILNKEKQETMKGDDTPTPSERAQLAANPAFAKAYEKRPAQTLHLLRWADDLVHRSQP